MASKLHGVEVDITIIKRKGDPIISTPDAENNCKYFDAQQMKTDKRNCTTTKYDAHSISNNNNNNNTQVPPKDSLCGKCESDRRLMLPFVIAILSGAKRRL